MSRGKSGLLQSSSSSSCTTGKSAPEMERYKTSTNAMRILVEVLTIQGIVLCEQIYIADICGTSTDAIAKYFLLNYGEVATVFTNDLNPHLANFTDTRLDAALPTFPENFVASPVMCVSAERFNASGYDYYEPTVFANTANSLE